MKLTTSMTTLLAWGLCLSAGCGAEPNEPAAAAVDAASTDAEDGHAGAIEDDTSDAQADGGTAADGGPSRGPWAVGVKTIEVIGANGRKLPTEVWYPISSGGGGEAAKYLNGIVTSPYGAIRDADPLPGPWPLVVFSHGNGGVRDQSVFLTEWLARHGYVVASPEHVGNSFWDMKDEQRAVMTLWRPQDLHAVIDAMVSPTSGVWYDGLVDSARVAVTGHSFGGYTSLAVAGLKVQVPPSYKIDCSKPAAQRSKQDQLVCPELEKLGEGPYNFGDPRVKLAIPLAHAGYGWQMLTPVGATDEHIPIIMMGASGDLVTPVSTEATPLYKDLSTPTALLTLNGGSHYSFANICEIEKLLPDNLKPAIGNICTAAASPSMEQTFELINLYALAAVDLYLRDDEQARATFKPVTESVYSLQSKGIYQP